MADETQTPVSSDAVDTDTDDLESLDPAALPDEAKPEDIKGLKSALAKLKAERAELKKLLQTHNPEKIAELEKAQQRAEEAERRAVEIRQQAIAETKAQYEARVRKAEQEAAQVKQEFAAAEKRSLLKDIFGAGGGINDSPEFYRSFESLYGSVFQVKNGELIVVDAEGNPDGKTPAEKIAEIADTSFGSSLFRPPNRNSGVGTLVNGRMMSAADREKLSTAEKFRIAFTDRNPRS